MQKMKIEIWSDIACPYCYIGKKKLEAALSEFPYAKEIEVIWHSYELDPSLPKSSDSQSYYKYLAGVKGISEEQAKEEFHQVLILAKEAGLTFNPDKIIVTNTSDALRLVKIAAKYDRADIAEEELFQAYFTDGENISDKDTLAKLGKKIDIPEADVIRMLEQFEYSEEVKIDTERAENELKLEYIPFYLLNNKYVIQGSVSLDEYTNAIEKAYKDWKENGTPEELGKEDIISGRSCSLDGKCS